MRSVTILGTAVVTAMVAVVLYGTNDAQGADGTRTLRFYEHDTQQASIDLADPGVSPGDEFLFSGDVFDHKGGTKLGRNGGRCTTMSSDAAGADEVACSAGFVLEGGQIMTGGVFRYTSVFGGETVASPIRGGTGAYRGARGEGTVQVPDDVPNQTDANFLLHLTGGD
jgi:hypothetical protein